MSNNLQRNLSQRKQVRSALERIDGLEQELPRIVLAINEALEGAGQRVGQLANIVEAVVELFGADTVDAKIKEIADRKITANLERAKQALADGLEKGDLLKADAIGEKALVVGRELDKDGNVVFPGRVQLTFAGIKPEFQEKLKGQGVGTIIETPAGGKFEVLEVYDVVEKAPPAAEAAPTEAPAAPEAAPEAPAPAETPAALEAALAPSES